MVDEFHIQALEAVHALERVVAATLRRFRERPDAMVREADLLAQMVRLAQDEPALWQEVTTADGHITPLLHLQQPPWAYASRGLPQRFALALLQPAFAQAQPLAVALNLEGQGALRYEELGDQRGSRPLLAALDLQVVDSLSAADMSQIVPAMNGMARSQDQAYYRYMLVFCRHWDLDSHLRRTLQVFDDWAQLNPEVSLAVAQAHRDDIGGVFGARYFGLWSQMAPLDPL